MTSQRTISASELVLMEKVENESAKTTLSMKDCVSQFAETSVGNSVVVVSSIHKTWEEVVGSDVSSHTKVRHVKNGVLFVAVDHPAWGTQLKYMQDKIVEQLARVVPNEKIQSIKVSISRK